MTHAIRGVHAAIATPVDARGNPDPAMLAEHALALLDEGCHGIALTGTTGEANSLGLTQRIDLLEAAIRHGVPAETILPGTGLPSVADTAALTRHAVDARTKGVLILPPHYYKDLDDEGLYRFYARVIEAVGDDRLRVVLYHIPQISMTPISHALIERLLGAFPGVVCGIKDSSGDLDNMLEMARRFPGLGVLSGADPLMLPLLQAGGAGCITGAANLCADALRVIYDGWNDPAKAAEVKAAQERAIGWRNLVSRPPQLATVKALVARRRDNPGWAGMLPPLVELDEAAKQDLWADMAALEAAS